MIVGIVSSEIILLVFISSIALIGNDVAFLITCILSASDRGAVINFGQNCKQKFDAAMADLTEDDVPGAKFVHINIEEHTNIQLKRWLKCRGLPTSGKRQDLLERCQHAVKGDIKVDPKIDSGKWLTLKKIPTPVANQVPYLPVSGFKKFPSTSMPKHFNNGHIYHYLVESVTSSDIVANSSDEESQADDLHTSKPFTKGKNLFRSGHVKNMQDVYSKGNYFVKASVLASYSQRSYTVTVTLSETTGMVREGTCTCSASGMGRCAHIAALLFALEDYAIEFGTDAPTCTDKLVQWNKGRRKNKNPDTVFNKEYPTMKKELKKPRTSGKDIFKSDPRPEAYRENELTNEQKNEFVSNLHLIGMECGWTNLLDYHYDDFTIDEYGKEDLKLQCEQFISNLNNVCSEKTEPFVVENTIGQSASQSWQNNRWCRLTASVAKDVKCVQTGYTGLVNKLLWSTSPNTTAILYGKTQEDNAFAKYKEVNNKSCVEQTGLWINPKYPALGCSPDGIVTDESNAKGLLEIKCPYVLRDVDPKCLASVLSTKQRNDFFCMSDSDGVLRLKRNHKYFFQVQMQLSICELDFCDFVVWSPHGISIERINRDNDMWNYTFPQLEKFHREYLVPEFFLKRIPRELEVLQFEY